MTELTYTEEVVPIEKLREDEEFRSLVPPNNMKEQLVSSIAKNGQTLPIDVDSSYIILDGYTRFQIFRELRFKEVKVRKWNFKSSEDRATAYKLIAMLNLQRRHLEKNEVLKLLRELAEKIEKSSKEVQKFSPVGVNLEHNNETNTKPADLELKMKQVKEEIGAKEVTDSDIQKYSIISTIPFLRQLVDDGKIPLRTAYELYTKAKDKLQKIANLPPTERNQLLTTKEGRKIILERDDLLQPILEHKMAVSQAINKIKTEEKLQRSKKKSRVKDEDLDETEDEGEEVETDEGEEAESDEYPFVEEWQKAKEEEKVEQQLTPRFNVSVNSSTRQVTLEVANVLEELSRKGFAKLDFGTEVVIAKISGKYYAILLEALKSLERGSKQYKDLADFLVSNNLAVYDAEEDNYIISWRSLNCS
ncbi:ParB N-terminal domain-containing protein [Sulfolobus acidocaldarius]|uniref:ParB N-terminal domain-containing protein n=1 Tax=Sulfolobus acidocaldarius TaxID=2285 RepID=UPI000B5AB8F7|nr:ParB N-terminal domain-containing protein [Sulfolobus acidocaldarius]